MRIQIAKIGYGLIKQSIWKDATPSFKLYIYMKNQPEGAGPIINVLDAKVLPVDVLVALVDGVEAELLEDPAGQQKSGAVGSGIVGQANLWAGKVSKRLETHVDRRRQFHHQFKVKML